MAQKPKPTIEEISNWINQKYSAPVHAIAPIPGGFWSAAYTFQAGDRDLVLRFSDMKEGFEADMAAMQFTSAELPIPKVFEIGEALGHFYAISERHYGRFLENVSVEEGPAASDGLARLLAGLRAVPSHPKDAVSWAEADDSAEFKWHDFLRSGLIDHPDSFTTGWRKTLAQNRELDAIFQDCESTINELLPHCPERRDLIHGDLLHQNVLISEDAQDVTAIFSWKCSVKGDFLYDVAWCTAWGPWHPGIAATDIWARTVAAEDLSESDLVDAPLRHHCYELQILASHFSWNIWTDNQKDLQAVAMEAKRILERGPLGV